MRIGSLREEIRSRLWPIPAACVVAAGFVAFGALRLDEALKESRSWYLFHGSAEAAQTLLSTTSAAMLTFIGLVFSITVVALQLTSGQFSPRVQRTFLRDRLSKFTLGTFIATFTYTVLVLRRVRSETPDLDPFIPDLSITVALLFVLLSVGVFVRYIDHIAHSIRVVTIIRNVKAETITAIECRTVEYRTPEVNATPHLDPSAQDIRSDRAGILTSVDTEHLRDIATRYDIAVHITVLIGSPVPLDFPIARVAGGCLRDDVIAEVRRAVHLSDERTMEQDVPYGLRQLVDVAQRALSPGINDPSTAVQVLDAIEDLLRRLSVRSFPDPIHTDKDSRVRVVLPQPRWEEILSLALDEIRCAGAQQIQIHRRIRALLDDLGSYAPHPRRAAISRMRDRLDETLKSSIRDPEDAALAAQPSRLGM